MQRLAEERGGRCLSSEYKRDNEDLTWQCDCGNIWDATPGSLVQGSWCPKCGGSQPLTLEDIQKLAKSKGGKCLSTEYINNRMDMVFECSIEHRWEATVSDIKGVKGDKGTWCPECASSISERRVRFLIECLCDCQFPKDGTTMAPLALDGYNSDLGLAFECQGIQHYQFTPVFHKTEENFLSQVQRDNQKRKNVCCKIKIPKVAS